MTTDLKMCLKILLTFFCFVYLKINELVDARDLNMGAWFEAQIVNVTKSIKTPKEEAAEAQEEEILYHVKYEE